ncbi:DUF3592 domain-containing protein [Thermobifida halotolerans]|uniref:DUF3592 domain-containing protein n=1 Tax=Thermobifida halotolerans TaxID=483545 RepID=A0AA97M3Q9_9ACTN|nr:DUF3592 domain-containing protein [Thermobifida halotolerans]UOE19433.1 DUF3592 domain-containing protein [Thermobifida halotolerans]
MKFSFRTGTRHSGEHTGPAVMGGFGAVLLLLGVIFVLIGNADYTDHTGRAEAVVVERDVDHRKTSTGSSSSDVDVYVSYRTEDGTQIEHAPLSGLNPSDYDEGERLQVAYHPDRPGAPVTAQSTEPGAFLIFRYLGIAAAVVGAALAAGAGILLWRRRS